MQLFPALKDDLLDVASLPSTDKTELNYRTRPLSEQHEQRLTLLVLFAPVPIVISLSAVANWLVWLHPLFENLLLAAAVFLLLGLATCRLAGISTRRVVTAGILIGSAMLGGKDTTRIFSSHDWRVGRHHAGCEGAVRRAVLPRKRRGVPGR
jgi:hypothetical protein